MKQKNTISSQTMNLSHSNNWVHFHYLCHLPIYTSNHETIFFFLNYPVVQMALKYLKIAFALFNSDLSKLFCYFSSKSSNFSRETLFKLIINC